MLKELSAFEKVTPQKLNDLIRAVNKGFDLKVSPPLEITRIGGNPQLRLTTAGFMAVVTNITQVYQSSFSSGDDPQPFTHLIYHYDVEELYQVKEGEWAVLPNGRKLEYANGFGVYEWNDNIVPVGTVVEVQQLETYDWRFFAPGGTVCNQPVNFWCNTPILNNQLANPIWQTLGCWEIPSAGTWLISITGGVALSVQYPGEPGYDYTDFAGATVFLQVTNQTASYPGKGGALWGTYVTPVTANIPSGTAPGYSAGTIGIRTFFQCVQPMTLCLQGFVYADEACGAVSPCLTFNANFTGEYGAQVQCVWIGPSCNETHTYTPDFLTGCTCDLAEAGEFDTLQDCLNYLAASDTGCGGSSSLSSSTSPSFPSPSSSSSGCACPIQEQFSTVTVQITGTLSCPIGGTFTLAWNSEANAFTYGFVADWQYPYISQISFTCNTDGTGTVEITVYCNQNGGEGISFNVSGSLCPLEMYGATDDISGCCQGWWAVQVTA